MNDLDGFGWGEPNFSASDNSLPDHRCVMSAADLKKVGAIGTDKIRFWRKTSKEVVVLDTSSHTVKRIKSATALPTAKEILKSASEGDALMCGAK